MFNPCSRSTTIAVSKEAGGTLGSVPRFGTGC